MLLKEIPKEDLIEPSWLDSYNKNIEALWWQLVKLNSKIYVLDKILQFPFDLFEPISPRNFWNLAVSSFFDSCIMILWRVSVDNSNKDGLTLEQLKNQILKHLSEENYKKQFRIILKNSKFDKDISEFRDKITFIRMNYIAHFNRQKNLNPTPEQIKERIILLSDLKKYSNTVNSFFDLLCFGNGRGLLLSEYNPNVIYPVGFDSRSDIEKLLDNIAKNSTVLNLPEQNVNSWNNYRKKLSKEELKDFNRFRVKFGLREE